MRFSGQRVREAREAAGLRREELALAVELSAPAIATIETGQPSLGALCRIATALDVGVEDLFERNAELVS